MMMSLCVLAVFWLGKGVHVAVCGAGGPMWQGPGRALPDTCAREDTAAGGQVGQASLAGLVVVHERRRRWVRAFLM